MNQSARRTCKNQFKLKLECTALDGPSDVHCNVYYTNVHCSAVLGMAG